MAENVRITECHLIVQVIITLTRDVPDGVMAQVEVWLEVNL